jgi:hypothetical protein
MPFRKYERMCPHKLESLHKFSVETLQEVEEEREIRKKEAQALFNPQLFTITEVDMMILVDLAAKLEDRQSFTDDYCKLVLGPNLESIIQKAKPK